MQVERRGCDDSYVVQLRSLAMPVIQGIDARHPELFAHEALLQRQGGLACAVAMVLLYLTNEPFVTRDAFAARDVAISDTAIRMMVAHHMAVAEDFGMPTGRCLQRLAEVEPGRAWAALPEHERFAGERATRRLIIDFAATGLRAAVSGRVEAGSKGKYCARLLDLLFSVVPIGAPVVAADMATRHFGRLLADLMDDAVTTHARLGREEATPCRGLHMAVTAMTWVLDADPKTAAAQQDLELGQCSLIEGAAVEMLLASAIHQCGHHTLLADGA